MLLSSHSYSPVELQCCIPDRSLGHSILVGQLVRCYLDSPASPVSLGYQADQVGPGCLSVLHLTSQVVRVVLEAPESQPL